MHFGCWEGFSDRSVPTKGSRRVWHAPVHLPGDNKSPSFRPSTAVPGRRALTITAPVDFVSQHKVVSSFLSAVLRSVIPSPNQPRGPVGEKNQLQKLTSWKRARLLIYSHSWRCLRLGLFFTISCPRRRKVAFGLCYLVVERRDERSPVCFPPLPTQLHLLLKFEISLSEFFWNLKNFGCVCTSVCVVVGLGTLERVGNTRCQCVVCYDGCERLCDSACSWTGHFEKRRLVGANR